MASASDYLVGAASLELSPPLGLPMVGFVRQRMTAQAYGRWPLEVSAMVVELDGNRVVLCGLDVAMIQAPEMDVLVSRVAQATGADEAGVLINFSHTHLAPPGGTTALNIDRVVEPLVREAARAFATVIHEKVISVCKLAASRLESARLVWGVGEANLAVNRRERTGSGKTILGWNPSGLVDNQVTALQARRRDGSSIVTLVGYGCHPVTAGMDVFSYSADYPGPLRNLVRRVTGGECVFFQAAAGNVLPRVGLTEDEKEAERMGVRLGVEVLHALADRYEGRRRLVQHADGSVTPISTYRYEDIPGEAHFLSALRERVEFPLQGAPSADGLRALRNEFADGERQARELADVGRLKVAMYHMAWLESAEELVRTNQFPTRVSGSCHAVRIGDGMIASAPGEVFTEYGLAVKERSPGRPTLYVGYTNGAVTYFSTAEEYPFGGYEPGYGNRSYGLPVQVTPDCEQILVRTAIRLGERLFPYAAKWPDQKGWTATGKRPAALESEELIHPHALLAEGKGDPA
jgi:neutral ceramidase